MAEYWQEFSLHEMSEEQWEALCDGCAKCCLVKLQDDDTEEVFYTNVSCKLLNEESCRCKDYSQRLKRVPECLDLNLKNIHQFDWLPNTCAYRLVYEGKELPDWHPLVSGNTNSVHDAGISVKGKVVGQNFVHEDALEDHIIYWVNE